MHKNVQTNPKKSQKLTQHSCCSMLTLEKKLKSRRGNGYPFIYKGETFPTVTMRLVVRSLYPNLPQMRQYFYHGMLMPLHDSMPCFLNYKQVLDNQNLKIWYLNVCGRLTVAGCLTFIPISCMGPKHATKDTELNFQPIYMHQSMCMQFKFELCT